MVKPFFFFFLKWKCGFHSTSEIEIQQRESTRSQQGRIKEGLDSKVAGAKVWAFPSKLVRF